ncbi:MAG: hypothetical protein KGV57_01420 [Fusobacterium sp.]|nr:hypothetical protein [Fusobacterium sp.]
MINILAMKKIVFILFLFWNFGVVAQNNPKLEIEKLKKEITSINKRIEKIIQDNPELKDSISKNKKLDLFNEELLDKKIDQLLYFLKENDIDRIEKLFQKLQNSERTKKLSDFILFEMNKAKNKLHREIEKMPKRSK